jgi:hypothetical protein
VARVWDRSITPSAFLKQASASTCGFPHVELGDQEETWIILGIFVFENHRFVLPTAAR